MVRPYKRKQRFLGSAIAIGQLGLGIYNTIQGSIDKKKQVQEENRINSINEANSIEANRLNQEFNAKNFMTTGRSSFYAAGGNNNIPTTVKLDEIQSVAKAPTYKYNTTPKTITYTKDNVTNWDVESNIETLFKSDFDELRSKNVSDKVAKEFVFKKYNIQQKGTTSTPTDTTKQLIIKNLKTTGRLRTTPKFALGGAHGVVKEASDLSVAYGATHEQQNNVDGGTGVPYNDIEVEGGGASGNKPGEVIKHEGDKDFIFSDRIPFDANNTFAQVAQKITKSKSNLENIRSLAIKEINDMTEETQYSGSVPKKNTLERGISKHKFKLNSINAEIAKIDDDIEQLKQAQLAKGKELGLYDENGQPVSENVEQFNTGGFTKFMSSNEGQAMINLAQTGINLASNISSANAMRKLKTPKYIPIRTRNTPLVNLSASKSAIDDSFKNISDYAENNFSSPQAAAIIKQRAANQRLQGISQIDQQENQINTGIIDNNISRGIQVDSTNAQMQYSTDMAKLQKDMQDINNTQNIVSGLSSDIDQTATQLRQGVVEDKMMALNMLDKDESVKRKSTLVMSGIDVDNFYTLNDEQRTAILRKAGFNENEILKYLSTSTTQPRLNPEQYNIVPDAVDDNTVTIGKYGGYKKRRKFAFGGIAGVNTESLDATFNNISGIKSNLVSTNPTTGSPNFTPMEYNFDKLGKVNVPKTVQSLAIALDNDKNGVHDTLDEFEMLLKEHGIETKRTSGYRNSKTSGGKVSRHARGLAIDLVPTNVSFDDMYKIIYNSPKIKTFATKNRIGILNENDNRVLKKTKGTGAHAHVSIGESIALDFWDNSYTKDGIYTDKFYSKYGI